MTLDDGTEYWRLAQKIAVEANAEFAEPIRRALYELREQRDDHWRRYIADRFGDPVYIALNEAKREDT